MSSIPDNNNEKTLYAVVDSFSRNQINESSLAAYRTLFENKIKLNEMISTGLSYHLFEKVQDNAPFSKEEWARFLDVSVKTLDRYKHNNKSFKTFQSEKIIGMIEVIERGIEVLGDMKMLKKWLYTPIPAFSDSKPIDLLNSSYGKELLLDELGRIEYGIFA
jgi:putative toxin-antitoxin system antitoxin component (TIGR02293 family)